MESYALEVFFRRYLEETTTLKKSTINHYVQGLRTISGYLRDMGAINDSIYEVSDVTYLFRLRDILFSSDDFKALNTRGNNMYSVGLKHYIKFAEATELEEHTVLIERIDAPVTPGGYSIDQGVRRWKRSALVRDQSIHNANYLCEIDSRHKTFISVNTGRQYMEGHRLCQ